MPKCPKDCKKPNCMIFRKTVIPSVVANDDITPPKNGDFCNMLVVYEATDNAYLFSSDGVPTLLSSTDYARLKNLPTINGVKVVGDLTLEDIGVTQLVEEEAETREASDANLQEQIDAIVASSDVVDIVGTYEELEEYDTSHLTVNDVIKVLADETEGGATTYYRWTGNEWQYIGAEGPYYTTAQIDALLDDKLDVDALNDYYDKDEVDALLDDKADLADLDNKQDKLVAGANITIDPATNVIAATVPSLANYYTKQETYSQNEVDGLIAGVEADIPTSTSQLTNDSGFLTTVPIATSQLLGGIKVGSGLSITQDGTLSADAQHIDVDTALSTTSTNPVENRVITNALNNKANIADIPTVPTNVSAFYNDAGYITNTVLAQNYYNKTETYNKTEVGGLIAGVEAEIPTKTSDLTNNSGYITSANLPTKTSDLTNDGSDGTAQYLETDETAYKTASIPYGVCDGTSTSTAFTATVPGITELRDGVCMWLKNGVVTSASGFTIDINNLGAKPVYSNMAAATRETTTWNINYTMLFVYDSTRVEGGCWIFYRGYYSDANSIGYQLRTNSTSLTTTDRTRYYRVLFTSADNTQWIPANTQYDNSATSNKTVNQRKINPFGRIVYLSNTTSYLAGAAVSATAVWDQYTFNLGYSFSKGSALTMTYPKPVYIKCAPQTDGSAIIDSTTPYVQDLPSTDDGKIYIYLGVAYSATNVEMVINHPIYYYKDGAIREWSNAPAAIASVAWGDITGTLADQSDLNTALGSKVDSSSLATVATSGSYNDLTNKPTIPAAQVNSDWNASSGVAQILNKPTLATVATSGSYNDLTNKPTIPAAQVNSDWNASSGIAQILNKPSLATVATSGLYSDLTGTPTLATVATTGAYSDLTGKPTIPTVNNATLTIQKNSTNVATFTANASSNVTANISVPTATSDLTNDSGFITSITKITNAEIDAIMGVS